MSEERVRYLFDENFPKPVLEGLRSRGVDVVTVQELNIRMTPDHDLLGIAAAQQRAIVTEDNDFLRLAGTHPDHWGIAFGRQGISYGRLVRGLILIWEVYTADEMRGQVEYL